MTSQLYLIPMPEEQTTRPPTEGTSANVSASGFIQQGGIAVENIATESVDLLINGQYRLGEFSQKLARELNSIGQSEYENIPFADDAAPDEDDQSGYYEISSADVNRAHESTKLAYEYTVNLEKGGTRASHWRAVETNSEDVNTGLATGSGGQIGIPTEANKVRWYSSANGTEDATVQSTVDAELGDIDLYDPTEPSFDNPTLIYSLSFDREGPVDVRVWDDVGESNKYASYDDANNTTHDITQWVHAYHSDFEFEGQAIIDNGLLRVRFDEGNNVIEAWEWDDANSTWSSVTISHGDWSLYDADIRSIAPAKVDVLTEWDDTATGTRHAAVLSFQRVIADAVVRQPSNGTVPSGLESVLDPIASDQTTDKQPETTVVARSDVK